MFGTIRRHQAWLWIVVAALTIISFLIFGPTNARLGDALRGQGRLGSINGKAISQDEFNNANKEATLRYFLLNGKWPDQDPNARQMGFNADRDTYQRLFLISKQEELGIHVSTEAIANFAHQILGKAPLEDFINQTLKPRGLTATDFESFLRHEAGVQQLLSVAGLSGKLVTPQEAKELFIKEHQDISASLVSFSPSNYMSSVTVKPESLLQFFTNRMPYYRIPEKVQVSYVKFDLTNYISQVQSKITNIDEEVKSVYDRYRSNFLAEAKTPEEAKAKIKQEMLNRGAMVEAKRAASVFAEELDQKTPKRASDLADLAKQKGLKVSETSPFSQDEPPADLDVSNAFVQKAFSLNAEEPFAGPIESQNGAYVIAFKQMIPGRIPTFKEVEAKVTADYKLYQGALLAQQAATAFAAALTNGLAQGKSFASIAAEAKVKPIQVPPFSLSTRELSPEIAEKVDLDTLKQIAFNTADGKASPFVRSRTSGGGVVVYVEKRLPVDPAKVDKELPDFLAYVRQMRQNESFNQWFSKQLDRDPAFKQTLAKAMQESQPGAGMRIPRS